MLFYLNKFAKRTFGTIAGPRGLMDKASDFGSEDWGFESLRGCCGVYLMVTETSSKFSCWPPHYLLPHFFWLQSVIRNPLFTVTVSSSMYFLSTPLLYFLFLFTRSVSSQHLQQSVLPVCPSQNLERGSVATSGSFLEMQTFSASPSFLSTLPLNYRIRSLGVGPRNPTSRWELYTLVCENHSGPYRLYNVSQVLPAHSTTVQTHQTEPFTI